jgi:superfamily II DNA or RNA helicase
LLRDILLQVKQQDLLELINSERLNQIKGIVNFDINNSVDIISNSKLVDIIIATFGDDILSDKKTRLLIFYTLPERDLDLLCKKYTKNTFSKPYDKALSLSILPWKFDSDFVFEVTKYLDIEFQYLPKEIKYVPSNIEISKLKTYSPLHDYQEEVKIGIIRELISSNSRFLIQMPTGSGKTRTVEQSLIEFVNNKQYSFSKPRVIVWLAHTEELCEQAIETFFSLWPYFSDDQFNIHRIFGEHGLHKSENIEGFYVGTLQKFYSLFKQNSYNLNLLKENTFCIVVDEAHKSTAKTYSELLNYLTDGVTAKLIGVTATPGRLVDNNKENEELANFFNKTLITPNFTKNPIIELREKKILSNLKRIVISTKIQIKKTTKDLNNISNDGDFSNITLNDLAFNVERNKIIIEAIINEIQEGNPTLVFACSVEHANILSASLCYKGYISASLDSNTSKTRRKEIITLFKSNKISVLFNFGILSTGFDATNIRTVIIARPTTSIVLYSQMIGRGLRGPKMGGADECKLIDIKDNISAFGNIEDVYSYFEGYWK